MDCMQPARPYLDEADLKRSQDLEATNLITKPHVIKYDYYLVPTHCTFENDCYFGTGITQYYLKIAFLQVTHFKE